MSRTPPAQLSRCPLRALLVFVLSAACSLPGRAQTTTAAGGPPAPAGASPPAEASVPPDASQAGINSPPTGTPPAAEVSPPASAAQPATAPPAVAPAAPSQPDESALVAPGKRIAGDGVGSRLIDVATPFTIGQRRFELLFTHRFDQAINQGANAHNLWGLDSGADVGIGFTYGLLRQLDLSVYRSSFQEDFELAAKLQVLGQSARMPLSAAVRAGADLLGRPGVVDPHRPFVQLLLGRSLAPGWNIFLSPSWVHDTPLLRNAWNVPVGLTVPLPGRWLLDGEVIAPNHALRDMAGASRLAWHAAFAKQVGWHVFQIVLGNSRATTVDQILGGDFAGGFTTHDLRLGFNLVRYFSP
jgi:Membrane bound beta barrel domain (DUF5777)